MRVSWPFLPIVIVIASVGVLVAAALLMIVPVRPYVPVYTGLATPSSEEVAAQVPIALKTAPGSEVRPQLRALLSGSPFLASREPFSRNAPISNAPAAEPALRPEFIGFAGSGASRRVLVVWERGGYPESLELGADSRWGILTSIEEDRLVFIEDEKSRTLTLFGE